ncbi:MAG: hypothetical protein JXP34_02260, partial [Planctomycetes bacterium]|nr:hypothetical protein [Planctomycetota bacterium]
LENGLVRAVIIPSLGGRIIEIANRATGANIFIDGVRTAAKAPDVMARNRRVPFLGGYLERLCRDMASDAASWKAPHRVDVIEETEDAAAIRTSADVEIETWGIRAPVAVQRTLRIARGSARIEFSVVLTNRSGTSEREFRLHQDTAFALGGGIEGDEFWLSSLGYATHVPGHRAGDAYVAVHAEDGTDPWQAIIDRDAREGVALLVSGEVFGLIDIYYDPDEKRYSYQSSSELREHVVDGSTIRMRQDFAPILDFDAVSFAAPEAAVAFVPETLQIVPGQRVRAFAAACLLAGDDGEVTLIPAFVREGEVAARLAPIPLEAPLLVAAPSEVSFVVPGDLEPGRYDLEADVVVRSHVAGKVRHRAFVADPTGLILSVLHPRDDGYGAGLSMTGQIERARAVVEASDGGAAHGVYRLRDVDLPWRVRVMPAGGAFRIDEEVDLSRFPKDALLASLGLAIPIRLGTDRTEPEIISSRVRWTHRSRMRATAGGSARDEQWLIDPTKDIREQAIPYWALSDTADRFPVWRLSGILQLAPTTAWTWRTGSADTAPLLVVQEERCAGWLDVHSQLTGRGVTAWLPDVAGATPRGIRLDAEAGVLHVDFFPPQGRALGLRGSVAGRPSRAAEWGLGADGRARFIAFLIFHEGDIAGDVRQTGNNARRIRAAIDGLR